MTFVWIALYVLGGAISVPIIARAYYDPAVGISKEAMIGLALVNAVVWPFWAVVGTGVLVSRLLTPLIFRDQSKGTGQGGGER